ncbi:MAG: beta galactosidase jelly roll domain-containing protein, partial [Chitinispirillaceae bacterium]|nr:beta galactosidase jelly roll domain-containing protein [Chitinispirillaceae bacterium]
MRHLIAMLFFASVLFAADAQAQTLTRMSPFNLNWKFYKGSPSGTPSQTAYADNSWPMVSVPHSVSYNEPTPSGEAAGYEGIAWYRKSFTVPASAKKVFLYFEGAMQTADVWINGISCGRHDNSGYTGFVFDISDKVARGTVNVCAVKLDNTRSLDIPPGVANPDYYLGSGIYRDVWLMFTDSVYIPYCGQRLGTRNVSTGTATVNAKTAVTNSSTVSKSCEITVTLVDSSGASVRSVTTTKIIAAGSTDTLIADISGISSPKLWSPEHPYLYSVRTMVKSGNNVVDSIAQPLGFRWFTWSATNGFSLNGSRYQLRGACVHQGLGWINSAVPNSRFYKQVEFIKEMGANSIRSSHYPRDPAFYDACDKLGMTLLVEIPTWGYSTASYSGACWTRFNSSVTEMITQGYNHPSIIAWGLFNEAGGDYSSQVRQLNATAHALDTTRPTYLANNPVQPHSGTADIFGMNYMLANSNQSYKLLNTEYHASWIDWCKRGNANDVDNSYANNKWRDWSDVVNAGPRLAGGYMWC